MDRTLSRYTISACPAGAGELGGDDAGLLVLFLTDPAAGPGGLVASAASTGFAAPTAGGGVFAGTSAGFGAGTFSAALTGSAFAGVGVG
jgi:hypothetical protein